MLRARRATSERHSSHRESRFAPGAATVATVAFIAMFVVGCTPESPQLTRIYPAQPDFAPSQVVASGTPTETTIHGSLTADLSAAGTPLDLGRLLNTAQGGYAPMLNVNWLADQAGQLSSMGIREIRFDHVLNDPFYNVVGRDAAGALTYDFSRLDKLILPLLANDIQPFISLSYMPSALGKTALGPPNSMADWSAVVKAFVAHYVELGHTGWGFEVWNEPDSELWTGTVEQYGDLYAASIAAVKSVDDTATVGGSAAAYIDSAKAMSAGFIDYLRRHPDVPIDYFTVHSYTANDWAVAETARAWLAAAGRPDVPVRITEWNNSSQMQAGPGAGSDSNNSPNGSSYIARRLFLAVDSSAEQIFYFSPVEGFDFNKVYNGDLGLVTMDGHRKSIGNVFEMYSQLDPTIIPAALSGPEAESRNVYGLVTKDEDARSASVLLWNNTTADAKMTLALDHLPFGKKNFQVVEKVIGSNQGNGFSDASTFVSPVYPSANENAPIVSKVVHEPATNYTDVVSIPANGVVSLTFDQTGVAPGEVAVSPEPSDINIAAAASAGAGGWRGASKSLGGRGRGAVPGSAT